MNNQEEHSEIIGRASYSINCLRKQMAELLVLREQVREAEALRSRQFSIREKNDQGCLQTLYALARETVYVAAKR